MAEMLGSGGIEGGQALRLTSDAVRFYNQWHQPDRRRRPAETKL